VQLLHLPCLNLFSVRKKKNVKKHKNIEELQKHLIYQAGGQSNETAKAAVDRLRAEGWLIAKFEDEIALLKNSNLQSANLQGADLRDANLQQAILFQANLQQANLLQANLQQANLFQASLQQAILYQANLQGAILCEANLQDAELQYINLRQADLRNANLREAKNIERAKYNEKTVLPDAMPMRDKDGWELTNEYDKYWTAETDMTRYTNPQHSDFWEPDYLKPGRPSGSPTLLK
jgi:hypothetical protein